MTIDTQDVPEELRKLPEWQVIRVRIVQLEAENEALRRVVKMVDNLTYLDRPAELWTIDKWLQLRHDINELLCNA